jgi:hypothetical protein
MVVVSEVSEVSDVSPLEDSGISKALRKAVEVEFAELLGKGGYLVRV